MVLHADDYGGGRLDWYEYEADHRGSLGASDDGARGHRRLVRHAVPTAAYYGGMPADRFWEFEPTTVRFGATTVGRTDLAHLLLDQFALGYGVDWFVIPLTLPTGSVCAVRELRVRDTFGIETAVERVGGGTGSWGMFDLATRAGDAELIYRLNTRVPENWHPFVPVRPPGAEPGAVELERRPIDRVGPDGTVRRSPPLGRVLTSHEPFVLADEEVGRDGRRTQVHWQLTRGLDGAYHSWVSHRVSTGRGEGSSGLGFDVSRPVDSGLSQREPRT